MEIRQNVRSKPASYIDINMFFIVKRVVDIIGSFILILILWPWLLIIFYRILKKDGGPILFRQVRMGKDNRPFLIRKFRTLTNPSKVIRSLPPHPFPKSWNNGVPDQFNFNRDPYQNVTHTGRWLKKYRLDRLPLLYNVLKGDMSLVGPSPEIIEIVEYYNEYQAQRLQVKPGITGFAQVNGNTNQNHDQKIRDDLFYIKNCSLKFDMIIKYRTIKHIFINGNFKRKRLL
ncbi:Sugar transferase involved in LPS biosynthesis (colanic, teichoic acid) [Virgibacillus subterraneus]|uniref:Sugar transferase involved in LPS biosynthesis (Colanic, teichoic acid) n=1 Tax=Virgibacillus subterraneus TaxID=621109 RepID=A0A1H9L3A0_9BACI|nr:sugar transferase [Virgibacillus subterraneus]SER05483.1 Sugar transferase involved in LPS biosynthesis (colanic, teichoic acid) [Virgibacillus subterraneus]